MGTIIYLNETIEKYINAINVKEPEILQKLRQETETVGQLKVMQIGWHQALFMQFLGKLTGAKRYLEIGTFTGYSALSMALALGKSAEIITFDKSEEWVEMAQRHWTKANVSKQIELIMGDGHETVPDYTKDNENTVDMAFIDADKKGIPGYYENCLKLVRPGGLILIDNVLWGGRVADRSETRGDTAAIRSFNKQLLKDNRVEKILTPIGDGLTLVMKSQTTP